MQYIMTSDTGEGSSDPEPPGSAGGAALGQDLRSAVRMLRRSPGFVAVAVTTLAIGVGANVAMFGVVRGALIAELPYPDDHEIYALWETTGSRGGVAVRTFEAWRDRSQLTTDVALWSRWVQLGMQTAEREPVEVAGMVVSPNYFGLLGANSVMGRTLEAGDALGGSEPVAVISHGLWERAFGRDPGVVGRAVTFDGTSRQIVGVVSSDFIDPTSDTDVWMPGVFSEAQRASPAIAYGVFARARATTTQEQLSQEVQAIQDALRAEYVDWRSDPRWIAEAIPLREQLTGDLRPALTLLMAAVGLVLLVASANLSNMILARNSARSHEFAIRTALGAGKRRIVTQLLAESAITSAIGAILGLLGAQPITTLFVSLAGDALPPTLALRLDATLVFFAFGLAMIAGISIGAIPALRAVRENDVASIRSSTRNTGGRERHRIQRFLIGAESALVVVLLIGAGLLTRSLSRMLEIEPGIELTDRVYVRISLPESRYPEDQHIRQFFTEMKEAVEQVPGVASVTTTTSVPLSRGFWNQLIIDGRPLENLGDAPITGFQAVSPGFFAAMGTPLIRGRVFTPADARGRVQTVVINETVAKRFFPGEDPLGRAVGFPEDAGRFRIIGIVENVQEGIAESPGPQIYLPNMDRVVVPWARIGWRVIIVHAPGGFNDAVAGSFRAAVWSVDPGQALGDIRPLASVKQGLVAGPTLGAVIVTSFALIGLLLGAVGIYGVVAYSVSRRTREVGIRLALGATRGSVLGLVVRSGMTPVFTGVALGLGAAFFSSRLLRGVLFGVPNTDPLTFVIVPMVLIAIASAATYIPARRALRVDPVHTLRQE